MKNKTESIEYHDTCPKCKTKMKPVKDKKEKQVFYYCKNCKQHYRIDICHPHIIVDCPHCNKKIEFTKEQLSQLHGSSNFNFYTRKVKIKSPDKRISGKIAGVEVDEV